MNEPTTNCPGFMDLTGLPYTSHEGKFSEMLARFPKHILKLFEKHRMTSIVYWVPEDAPTSQNTLIYVIAHPSREDAKKNFGVAVHAMRDVAEVGSHGSRVAPEPVSNDAKWSLSLASGRFCQFFTSSITSSVTLEINCGLTSTLYTS